MEPSLALLLEADEEASTTGDSSRRTTEHGDSVLVNFPSQIGVNKSKLSTNLSPRIMDIQTQVPDRTACTTTGSALALDSKSTSSLRLLTEPSDRASRHVALCELELSQEAPSETSRDKFEENETEDQISPTKPDTKTNKWQDRLAEKRISAAKRRTSATSGKVDSGVSDDNTQIDVPVEKSSIQETPELSQDDSLLRRTTRLKTPTTGKAQKWKDCLPTKNSNEEVIPSRTTVSKQPVSQHPAFQISSLSSTTKPSSHLDRRSNSGQKPTSLLPAFDSSLKSSRVSPTIKGTTMPLSPQRPSFLPTLKTKPRNSPSVPIVQACVSSGESTGAASSTLLLPTLDKASRPSTTVISSCENSDDPTSPFSEHDTIPKPLDQSASTPHSGDTPSTDDFPPSPSNEPLEDPAEEQHLLVESTDDTPHSFHRTSTEEPESERTTGCIIPAASVSASNSMMAEANSALCFEILRQELRATGSDITDSSSLLMDSNSCGENIVSISTPETNLLMTIDTKESYDSFASSSSKAQKWKDRLTEIEDRLAEIEARRKKEQEKEEEENHLKDEQSPLDESDSKDTSSLQESLLTTTLDLDEKTADSPMVEDVQQDAEISNNEANTEVPVLEENLSEEATHQDSDKKKEQKMDDSIIGGGNNDESRMEDTQQDDENAKDNEEKEPFLEKKPTQEDPVGDDSDDTTHIDDESSRGDYDEAQDDGALVTSPSPSLPPVSDAKTELAVPSKRTVEIIPESTIWCCFC
jgi:hypothetical protein